MSAVGFNNVSPVVGFKTVNSDTSKNQVNKEINNSLAGADSVNIGVSRKNYSSLKTGALATAGAAGTSAAIAIPTAVAVFKSASGGASRFGAGIVGVSILALGAASAVTGSVAGTIAAKVTDSKKESAIMASVSSGLALGTVTGAITKSLPGAAAGFVLGAASGAVAGYVAKK